MVYHRVWAVTAILMCGILGVFGCSQKKDDGKLQVVVSVLPQAEFAEAIGGEMVDVSVMIPPGGSPATYEPTPSQLRDLAQAKLYVRIGHIPFERAWLDKILRANSHLTVVDTSEGIEIVDNDPHIWNSPRLVKIQVEHICQALIEVDPQHRSQYTGNKTAYLRALDELDMEIRKALGDPPQRAFLVFHPVWGYFARDYGLEQIAIEEEGKEPSASDIAHLIGTAKAKGIKVVFVQPQFSERHAEVVAQQLGGSLVEIDPLARDYRANLRQVAETIAETLHQGGD